MVFPIDFRVHEHARVLARYLVDDALNRADYDAVVTYASQLIREDPCDEWAHEVTIRAYLESHNREKAAKAYETYSTSAQAGDCRRAFAPDAGTS